LITEASATSSDSISLGGPMYVELGFDEELEYQAIGSDASI
jgi:hypothetical protein